MPQPIDQEGDVHDWEDGPLPVKPVDPYGKILGKATGISSRKANILEIAKSFLGGARESTIDPMGHAIIHPIDTAKAMVTGKGSEGAARILQSDVDALIGRPTTEPSFQRVPIVGPMVASTYAGVREPLSEAYKNFESGDYELGAENVGRMTGVVANLIAPEAMKKKAGPTPDQMSKNLAGSILKKTPRNVPKSAPLETPSQIAAKSKGVTPSPEEFAAGDRAAASVRENPPGPLKVSPEDYIKDVVRGMLGRPTKAAAAKTEGAKQMSSSLAAARDQPFADALARTDAAPAHGDIGSTVQFEGKTYKVSGVNPRKGMAYLQDEAGQVQEVPSTALEPAPTPQTASPVTRGAAPEPAAAPVGAEAPVPEGASVEQQFGAALEKAKGEPGLQIPNKQFPATVSEAGRVNPNLSIPDNPDVKVVPPPGDFPQMLMTRGERTGSKPMRMMEGMVEGSLPGAGRFEELRLAQQKELTGAYAERVLDYVGKRGTAEDVGRATQEALKEAKNRIKAPIYSKVNRMGEGVKVTPTRLKVDFQAIKDDLSKGNLKVPLGKDSTLLKVLDTGINTKGQVSFNELRTFRSQIRSLMPKVKSEIGTAGEAHITRMLEAVDRTIEAAASRKPGLFQEWQTAQGKWANLRETFNKSTAGKILGEKDPGKVHLRLKTAPLEDLRKVRELVGDNQFNSMKARLLEDMMTKATEGELRPSGPVLGVGESSSTSPRFSGSSLRKQLESLGSERLQSIFDKSDLDNIYKLSDVAERVGKNGASRLGGLALNLPLLWGAGKTVSQVFSGDLTGALASAAKTGGTAAGTNILARVMTRRGGPTVLNKLAEAVEKGNKKLPAGMRLKVPPASNRAEAAFWAQRMGSVLKNEFSSKREPEPEDWTEPTDWVEGQ
jgi:hypothetical protein